MIQLSVNGQIKQHAPLHTMIWNVEEIISELSKYYRLRKGDLIMTGTPSGVGPLHVGDHVVGKIVFDEVAVDKDEEENEIKENENGRRRPEESTSSPPSNFYIEPVEFVIVE